MRKFKYFAAFVFGNIYIRILKRNLTSQLIQWQKKQTAYCQYLKSVCKRRTETEEAFAYVTLYLL